MISHAAAVPNIKIDNNALFALVESLNNEITIVRSGGTATALLSSPCPERTRTCSQRTTGSLAEEDMESSVRLVVDDL